jgi:hypothetical protein
MKNRKLGKFYATYELIESEGASEVFAALQFVPLRAEALEYKKIYEYIGTSPLFSEVEEGAEIPEYRIVMTRTEAGLSVDATQTESPA